MAKKLTEEEVKELRNVTTVEPSETEVDGKLIHPNGKTKSEFLNGFDYKGKHIRGMAEQYYRDYDTFSMGDAKAKALKDWKIMKGFVIREDKDYGTLEGVDISKWATDPGHELKTHRHYNKINKEFKGKDINTDDVTDFIKKRYPDSPVTGEMIISAAHEYNIPWKVLLAISYDSALGTAGIGKDTYNVSNLGNDDEGNTRNMEDSVIQNAPEWAKWTKGLEETAKQLYRYKLYDADTEHNTFDILTNSVVDNIMKNVQEGSPLITELSKNITGSLGHNAALGALLNKMHIEDKTGEIKTKFDTIQYIAGDDTIKSIMDKSIERINRNNDVFRKNTDLDAVQKALENKFNAVDADSTQVLVEEEVEDE